MRKTHDGKQSAGERGALICVTVKMAPEDRDALQSEALRLRIEGRATRIDASAIVRSLIREWRASLGGAAR
jgi:hypothetical protein